MSRVYEGRQVTAVMSPPARTFTTRHIAECGCGSQKLTI